LDSLDINNAMAWNSEIRILFFERDRRNIVNAGVYELKNRFIIITILVWSFLL
jgi:hypothetical protein